MAGFTAVQSLHTLRDTVSQEAITALDAPYPLIKSMATAAVVRSRVCWKLHMFSLLANAYELHA